MNLFPIVILAGGLATRLRPVSEHIPKALIDTNGEPFISHQLRLLKKNGAQQVIMCIGYLGEMIVNFVGDGSAFGLNVSYVSDGPTLLGTAGCIKQALPQLASDAFFTLYGDSYLPCDYLAIQQAFVASNKTALMTVFCNNGRWDTSNVEFTNNTILSYDKINKTDRMHYIDYGLGLFNKSAFSDVSSDKPHDLAVLYQTLLAQQQLAAYEVTERFYESGSFSGIDELTDYLIQQKGMTNELY